jgi:hypothetical protein
MEDDDAEACTEVRSADTARMPTEVRRKSSMYQDGGTVTFSWELALAGGE